MNNRQILQLWLQSFQGMCDDAYYGCTVMGCLDTARENPVRNQKSIEFFSELLENNPGAGRLTIFQFHSQYLKGKIKI